MKKQVEALKLLKPKEQAKVLQIDLITAHQSAKKFTMN